LKNYDLSGAGIVENHQHHHMHLQQQHDIEYLKNMKSLEHPGVSPYADQSDKNNLENEPNNNTKNNSSSSSYDDVIDYDDSIQNHDLNVKESGHIKRTDSDSDAMKYKCNEYMKSFDNVRSRYEDLQQQQPSFNGGSVIADEYRGNTIDERKMGEDGNSNDMRMNYASSDELNQTTASSDHGGEKAGSGSDDEGNMGNFISKNLKEIQIINTDYFQMMPVLKRSTEETERPLPPTNCTNLKEPSKNPIIQTCILAKNWQ
jgi:hypothetical protein